MRIGIFVVLLATTLVAVVLVPIRPSPLAPATTIAPPAGLTGSCFTVRVADSRLSRHYPDTIRLTGESTGASDSTFRVRTPAGYHELTEWRAIRGDSLELRRHHEPTIRLGLGGTMSGTMYLPWTRTLFATIAFGGSSPVSLTRTECPQPSRATG